MDGLNEDTGGRLVFELKTNLKMILEYASTLEGEKQKTFINELDLAVEELSNFGNDLGINIDEIGAS